MRKRSVVDILRSMQHLEEIFVHDIGIVRVSFKDDLNDLQLYVDTNAMPNMLDGEEELMLHRGAYKNKEEATKHAEKHLKTMMPIVSCVKKLVAQIRDLEDQNELLQALLDKTKRKISSYGVF